MTICFVFWGHYAGAVDAIRCAVARGGCPVVVVSERPHGVKGAEWISIHTFTDANEQYQAILQRIGPHRWKAPTLARWLVLADLMDRRPDLKYPVANLDWDVLLFSTLADAYAPFTCCDYAISSYYEGSKLERSAAYVVNSVGPLTAYVDKISRKIASPAPWGEDFQDMRCWAELQDEHGFMTGNLFTNIGGAVWDHNIAVLDGRFEAGPDGYKRVEFAEGTPYFVGVDGVPVRAHSIHAWGQWKTKTGELRAHAGIS